MTAHNFPRSALMGLAEQVQAEAETVERAVCRYNWSEKKASDRGDLLVQLADSFSSSLGVIAAQLRASAEASND